MSETFNVNINQESKNKDELDKVIDKETLAKLKERFPEKMDEIFKVTQEDLNELKTIVNWPKINKQEKIEKFIRKNLIEDDIDGNEPNDKDKLSLDTLILWTNLEKMKKVKWVIDSEVKEKLKKYNFLKPEQITNISIAVAAKVFKSNKNDNIFWRILKSNWNKVEKKAETNTVSNELKEILSILKLDNWMKNIISVIEENKGDKKKLDWLLSNPKAIENLDNKTDIENIWEPTQKDLTEYLLNINKDVLAYEKKLNWFNKHNGSIVSLIAKSPKVMQNLSKKALEMLFKIPFIGEILAMIMWYGSAKEAQEWFWEDLKYAKSTDNLISHWKNKETNPISIDILKDKDLNWLNYKKLKPFFKACEKEWIDYSRKEFWSNLFNNKTDESNKKFSELVTLFNQSWNKINADDFKNKKPEKSFYEKLNKLKLKEKVKEKDEKKKNIVVPTKKWKETPKLDTKKEDAKKETQEEVNDEEKNILKLKDIKDTITDLINKIKLNKEDLEDLKSITIEELLDEKHRGTIEWKIWVYDYFKADNNNLIYNMRNYLLDIKKDDLIKLVWKDDLSKIKLLDLYDDKRKTA